MADESARVCPGSMEGIVKALRCCIAIALSGFGAAASQPALLTAQPLSGQGYGQECPGTTPVIFSPKFIRTDHRIHSSPTFAPDMSEVYWSVLPRTEEFNHRGEVILFSRKVNGKWSSPEVAPFSGKYADGGPLFSLDGKKLYFYSRRPLDSRSDKETNGAIWSVERDGVNWGAPHHVDLNFEGEQLFFSMSSNANIYFTSGHGYRGAGVGSVDIYCARFTNGSYAKAEKLTGGINSERFVESDPLISPDEKYLVFYSLERPENTGQYDLYISRHLENGQWTTPVNLGAEINKGYSRFPRWSPDGKYMFFVRSDGVYWVESSRIDSLSHRIP